MSTDQPGDSAYARAGVNIANAQQATNLMGDAVRATYGPEVLAGLGAFGGLYDAAALQAMPAPVLVASTDGVGTKTLVAARLGQWDNIGRDLVNHCVNDILVQGARPLFFLDYVAAAQLDALQVATVVQGVAAACQAVGCALLGGETAEMPGVYQPGALDLVGTVIGVVDRAAIIDGTQIAPGDAILALPASGLHTNGYSLARRVLADLDWDAPHPPLGQPIGAALLAPHRCYLEPVRRLQQAGIALHGLAHITGGGVIDNLPRVLPAGTAAQIWRGTWPEPPIFGLIAQQGQVAVSELFQVFNMGLGMLVVVPAAQRAAALAALPGELFAVGEIVPGARGVVIEATRPGS